jgi:hypothetical protein
MSRRNPLRTALLAYAVVAALLALAALAELAARLLPLVLLAGIAACIWLGWHRARLPMRSSSPARQVPPPPDLSGEVVRLQAEVTRLLAANDQLRAERDDAIEGMHRAWDLASDKPPRPGRESTSSRDQLINTPLSQIHDLRAGQ